MTKPFVMASILARRGPAVVLALVVFVQGVPLFGNDSAAEAAAGGIQLRKESRISMEKERLTISLKKVSVKYEFLNTTDQDIVTEVAFPMPPYEYVVTGTWYGAWNFTNFRVWVDGREIKYETEARAKLHNSDYTDLLQRVGVDIQTFGHLDALELPIRDDKDNWRNSQIAKLTQPVKADLTRLGLLDPKYALPTWTVFRTYFWSQRFPARKTVRVRHDYEPVIGFRPVSFGSIQSDLKDACIDGSLQKKLRSMATQEVKQEGGELTSNSIDSINFESKWVRYVLTTANSWKTPIKDFELILERPQGSDQLISLCWDGKVQRLDENHFVSRRVNFIPSHDLTVYFLEKYY